MDFDSFTVVLLLTPAAPPQLDDEAAGAIQDQHLNFLAELHESGKLLAAGPLLDPDRRVRGLSSSRIRLFGRVFSSSSSCRGSFPPAR